MGEWKQEPTGKLSPREVQLPGVQSPQCRAASCYPRGCPMRHTPSGPQPWPRWAVLPHPSLGPLSSSEDSEEDSTEPTAPRGALGPGQHRRPG